MVARPLPFLVVCSIFIGLTLGCGEKAVETLPPATAPLIPISTPEAVPAEPAHLTTDTLPLSNDALSTSNLTPTPSSDTPATPTLQDVPSTATLPAGDDKETTDSDTSSASVKGDTPRKLANTKKTVVLPNAEVIEKLPAETKLAKAAETEQTKSATGKKEKSPAETMTLRAYLTQELGAKKFRIRSKWAGGGFEPRVVGNRVWKPLGNVKFVTIHHADGVPDEHPARMIRNIFTGHTTPGGRLNAPDVGYHFFVDRDGVVWEGRDASKRGTHVGSKPAGLNNAGNIGICGLGTFKSEGAPRKMSDGIVNLTVLIAKYYGHTVTVRGHKDWLNINEFHPYGGCDCPGHLQSAVKRARTEVKVAFAKKAIETEAAAAEAAAPAEGTVETAMAE